MKVEEQVIEGSTALWAAAATARLDIVRLLVSSGADVDGRTKTNSTPLRAAAYDGTLDIVQYLVSHGADTNARNNFENTPLMVACYNGHLSVVSYLLDNGADIDFQDRQGNTVMHYAVERNHPEIVRDLVMRNAGMLRNKQGLTPLFLASTDCKVELVEFFISRPSCSNLDRISSLELLGATIANEPDFYDSDKALQYMKQGMALRYEDSSHVIPKKTLPPLEVYQNRVECQNLEELESIRGNNLAIHLEGLIVRERILGPCNAELRFPIRYRGAVFADTGNFDQCVAMWKHALEIGQKNDVAVTDDIKIFADFFCHMVQQNVLPKLQQLRDIFSHAVTEYAKLTRKISEGAKTCKSGKGCKDLKELREETDGMIHRMIYFVSLFARLDLSEAEELALEKLIQTFLRLSPRTQEGKSLLHLAVWYKTPVEDHYVKDVCKFPCLKLANLLMDSGANFNAKDNDGNTPLHLITSWMPTKTKLKDLEKLVESFIQRGAHEDMTNNNNETVIDRASSDEVKAILFSKRKILLKCLAAKVVVKHKIPYEGIVPKVVERFVSVH